MFKAVEKDLINEQNIQLKSDLQHDFEYLEKKLQVQISASLK